MEMELFTGKPAEVDRSVSLFTLFGAAYDDEQLLLLILPVDEFPCRRQKSCSSW